MTETPHWLRVHLDLMARRAPAARPTVADIAIGELVEIDGHDGTWQCTPKTAVFRYQGTSVVPEMGKVFVRVDDPSSTVALPVRRYVSRARS